MVRGDFEVVVNNLMAEPSVAVCYFHRDITERKRAEKAGVATDAQLVIDNIPQFIFWKDRNSVYLGCAGTFAGCRQSRYCWENRLRRRKKEEANFFRESDRRVMETGTPNIILLNPAPG